MRSSHGNYLLAFLLFLLPVALLAGMNVLYLRATGEFKTISDIVEQQQADPRFCLYGTALHDDTSTYKQQTYARRKPAVVAVGSSVMMEIRERFFRVPFYNLGGTMDSVINGLHTISTMTAAHKPKVLLLGLDWWWFPAHSDPYQRTRPPRETERLTAEKVFRPFSWIAQGKVSIGDYLRSIMGQSDSSTTCNLGVVARTKRHGFAPDGSYYYSALVTGREEPTHLDVKFEKEKDAIAEGSARFGYDEKLNERSLRQFIDLVRDLEAQGIQVVLFFQPVARDVYADMQRHRADYRYIDLLQAELHANSVPFLDFLDSATIHSPDCEFIDGIHGGDVTYARLLRKIHDTSKDPAVRAVFDLSTIDATLRSDAGRAMARDPRVTEEPEVDFLELGCAK